MFLLNIKLAFRNIVRNKSFTVINSLGLSIGLTTFLLIMLYVKYEKSYDSFFGKHDRIYRVYMDYIIGGEYSAGDAQTYNGSAELLKINFAEVEDAVRLYQIDKVTFSLNNEIFQEQNGHVTDPSYFNTFAPELIKGDINTALSVPNQIVLCKNLATRIFGKEDPVGKTITAFNDQDKTILTVAGVMKNIPENTHQKTNFLISYETLKTWPVAQYETNWNNNNFFTYILLKEDADPVQFKNKLLAFDDKLEDERHNFEPITDIHLLSNKPYEAEINGNAQRVRYLFAIAFIVVILSWLNYINLSISKSAEQVKESGIRITSGAKRAQLISKYLTESFVFNSIAILISVLLFTALLPTFRSLTGRELSLNVIDIHSFFYVLIFVAAGIITTGLLPALVITKYKPVEIIKGKFKLDNSILGFKKGFVVVQFTITIILLVSTIVINNQIQFMRNKKTFSNKGQTLAIQGDILENNNNLNNKFKILKEELHKIPGINAVSTSQTYPGKGYYSINSNMGVKYPNGTVDNNTTWFFYDADENYISLMDLEMLAGNNFTGSNSGEILVNQEAAKIMGYYDYSEIVGKKMKFTQADNTITGVIKNYHHFGYKDAEKPMIIRYRSVSDNNVLVKLDNNLSLSQTQNVLANIKNYWDGIFSKSTFNYTFVDKQFESQFKDDIQFNKAFSIFTILAIIIASLGLYGLASYASAQRTKEIGVRKVNGARITEVLIMLNKDFMQWVVLAFIIACPLAYTLMQSWLSNFALRTTISWTNFIYAGLSVLLAAIFAVSWQSWRAATRNPVEALRYE